MAPTTTPVRLTLLPLAAALALAVLAARPALAQVPVNEPPALPVSIAVLPSADGIEASGFQQGDLVDVQLIRNGVVISTATGLVPEADPKAPIPFAGIVDVNPAGCWDGVTPDVRAGDIVRFIAKDANGKVRSIDQVHVMPIVCSPPILVQNGPNGIVELHGIAPDLTGAPIPIDNLQVRLIGGGTLFALNGKRTLRAGGGDTDGTLAYDLADNVTGFKWTARFTGLSAGDVSLAMASDARVLWLGSIPANVNELTIYENSDGVAPGPAGGCAAPLEAGDVTPPTAPSSPTSTQSGPTGRQLDWGASTDDVAVAGYEVTLDGAVIGVVGPLVTTFTDNNVPAGSHTYKVVAFDDASARGAGATLADQIKAGLGQPYGNRSAPSTAVSIVQADVIPPSTPGALTVATGNGKAMPSWSPSTDNVGVVSYEVFRNNVPIASVPAPTTTYKDSGLVTGPYTYSIDAVDAAGLHSARTAGVTVNVVFIPDTTPPTTPTATGATSPDVHGRNAVITWTAATDSMGVTGYRVFRNGAVIATLGPSTLSYRDSALATATYTYRVDAFDAANNHSAASAAATVVIANDPPLAPHALIAHPSRDWVEASGYPVAQGPYVFTVLRGTQVFSSAAIAVSGGLVQVNHAGGNCWQGATPDLRAGDVVRITNAAGIAEQSTVSDITTQFAYAIDASTVVVHGTARDAAGHPIPVGQLEHRLVAASGTFAKSGTSTLRAGAGLNGSLAYDAPGSVHWTATYSGLSATDVALATGGVGAGGALLSAAESRGLWLGRSPAAANEQSAFETGPAVMGGPAASVCSTPTEASIPVAAFAPAAIAYGDVGAIPPATSASRTIEFRNTGSVPMTIYRVYLAGPNTGDFVVTTFGTPTVLAPNASFTVDVAFAPKALGHRRAMLCLSCDAANTTALSVALDGVGATDTTPPTVPAGVAVGPRPDVHGHDAAVSWSAASDSVGVTGYTVYRDGAAIATVGGTTLSYLDAGLAPATHVYAVDAFDLQNNRSAKSAPASIVIATEPPVNGHVLVAHPARDWIAATGYPAAQGPYVFTLIRGNQTFTSVPVNADAGGLVEVNHAGACWSGVTPDVRRGDVVRITNAAGFADQTTVADITAGFAIAVDSATIVVHGTARDAAGQPLPLDQLAHDLSASTGVFEKTGTATMSARSSGGQGTIAYDGQGSIHWTATYTGLSAADVARAAGGTDTPAGTCPAAESRAVWLGHSPATGTEGTVSETGPAVMGGPTAASCAAPAESGRPAAAFTPAALMFGRLGLVPPTSVTVPMSFSNTGSAPMAIQDVRIVGLDAGDYSIVENDAPAVLGPGESFKVVVAFTPQKVGHRQAAIALSCDAANTTALSVPLVGQGWSGLVLRAPGAPSQAMAQWTSLVSDPTGVPGNGTVPVRVRWTPSPSSWVTGYDLQLSMNGGPWADAAVQPGAATEATLPLALNVAGAPAAYRFRVRAAANGETTNWVQGSLFGLEPVDETNNARVSYLGAGVSRSMAGAYGGTIRTIDVLGVKLLPTPAFQLPGSIAWITTTGPDRGMVSVQVDGGDSVVVDLYSPTLEVGVVGYVAENLAGGRKHTMVVHSLIKRNALATANRVDADAFVVMVNTPRAVPALPHGPGGASLTTQGPEPPSSLSFRPIAPNPAVDRATLTFALPRDGAVRVDVMDVQGRLVRRLAEGLLPAGEHSLAWDGRTGAGTRAGSGVYFAVVQFENQAINRRLIWMP